MTDFGQILLRELDAKEEKKEKTLRKTTKRKKETKTSKSFVVAKKTVRPKLSKPKRTVLTQEVKNPVWLSLFEAATIGGVEKRTIKRAIKNDLIKYKIVDNRYQVEFRSVILFLTSKKKLLNKLNENGVGQYIERWIK